jgi:hypothetical protein
MRRKRRSASRRRSRSRRNPRAAMTRSPRRATSRRAGGRRTAWNPRRRRRARRNPLVPTSLLQRGLAIAAGFIAAPKLAGMIPVELPGGKIGQYVKEFLVVTVGSQLVSKALGKKYGQALFAGGVIHIGVDMLQTYVAPFGGGTGVGYYWPPDSELGALYGGTTAAPGLPDSMGMTQGRLAPRFQ